MKTISPHKVKAVLSWLAMKSGLDNGTSHDVWTDESILTGLSDQIRSELVSGRLCGVMCEVCPLRAWKSSGITPVTCDQMLTVARQRHPWNAGLQSTVTKVKALLGTSPNLTTGAFLG